MKVAICIATFRRPTDLTQLLEGISQLDVPSKVQVAVVIVDNDAAGSARGAVERTDFPWPIAYHVEPRQGISFARNRAVGAAMDWADVIAFLDDDECPQRRWLAAMLQVRGATGAAVITGPVLARLAEPVAPWIHNGRFFERPRWPTGTLLPYTHTGNVMVDAAVFRDVRPHFDERLALSGGEDTEFFLRVTAAGYRIVWADEAEVVERIPASRARPIWLLRRAFRQGSVWAHCEGEAHPGWGVRSMRAAKGIAHVAVGFLGLLSVPLRGRAGAVAAFQRVAQGLGNLAGIVGFRYAEYRSAGE
jgi:succinoglycan biosynthesis protein ExoM